MINKKVIAFVILFAPSLCFAAFSDSGLGTSGAAFLKLGAGARAAAMGGAFTSAENYSSDGMYWNPAGLAFSSKKDLTLMYSSYFEDISYEWLSFSMPTEYGVFGAAFQYLSYGSIRGTDINGLETSDFSPYDLAVYLSYARGYKFGDSSKLGYGANLKYVYSKIDNSASAFAIDAGAAYTLKDGITSFGAVLQNMGTALKYNEEKESLPLMFKLGASRIFKEVFLASFDIIFPSDNSVLAALGGEYKIRVIEAADVFLRAGYDLKSKDVPGFTGFNAGFGVRYLDYVFDYAFSPYGDLGIVHRVSLGIQFGGMHSGGSAAVKPKKERKKPKNEEERSAPASSGRSSETYKPAGQKESEPENREFEAAKSYYNVAVLNFVSKSVPKSECGIYASMLRKALSDTDNMFPVDKSVTDSVYGGNSTPSSGEIFSIAKASGADKIIACSAAKTDKGLHFAVSVYDIESSSVQKYGIISDDSFADVQRKLREFVNILSGE
ncbi:MAG: PorV/PorQ family protein [Endomicrobium sp.]|nr:PorV/PorQ family protein [Endomicrobium sp.]